MPLHFYVIRPRRNLYYSSINLCIDPDTVADSGSYAAANFLIPHPSHPGFRFQAAPLQHANFVQQTTGARDPFTLHATRW